MGVTVFDRIRVEGCYQTVAMSSIVTEEECWEAMSGTEFLGLN